MEPKSQLDLYREKQAILLEKYYGKILALKDGEVVGIFESQVDALRDMKGKYKPGSFLIVKCLPGDGEFTRRFRSRVDFPCEDARVSF